MFPYLNRDVYDINQSNRRLSKMMKNSIIYISLINAEISAESLLAKSLAINTQLSIFTITISVFWWILTH